MQARKYEALSSKAILLQLPKCGLHEMGANAFNAVKGINNETDATTANSLLSPIVLTIL